MGLRFLDSVARFNDSTRPVLFLVVVEGLAGVCSWIRVRRGLTRWVQSIWEYGPICRSIFRIDDFPKLEYIFLSV